MHGSIISGDWFDLAFRDKKINKRKRAKEWLEECTSNINSTLNESAFGDECAKVFFDLTTYGTGALLIEQKNPKPGEWEGLTTTAVGVKEIYFEPDEKDRPGHFYRLLNWPLSKIVDKFGLKALPENKRNAYAADPERRYELIFCIFRRQDIEPNVQTIVPKERMPYGYKYLWRECGTPIGEEGGYYQMPAFLPRWRLKAESMWGWSPAMDAMGDVISCNELVRMDLRAREMAIDPPHVAEERSIIGELQAQPRGLTLMRDINRMRPLNTNINYGASIQGISELQDRIREYFFVPQLELKISPAMTATEVNVRYQKMQEFMSPTLGRIRADLLDPVVSMVFNTMMREGVLPPMPDEVAGAEWDVTYHGQVQRSLNAERAAAMQNYVMSLAQMAEAFPSLRHVVNPVEFARELAVQADVPQSILRDEDEVRAAEQAEQEMQQRMMEAEAEAAEGAAAESVGKGAQAIRGI